MSVASSNKWLPERPAPDPLRVYGNVPILRPGSVDRSWRKPSAPMTSRSRSRKAPHALPCRPSPRDSWRPAAGILA
jgi:hypothetical protein